MAIPKVGITAEFLLREYLKNKKKYTKSLKDIEAQTKKTAASVTKSTGQMVKSARDLFNMSKMIQASLKGQDIGEQARVYNELSFAWDKLATSGQVNLTLFDQLVNKGVEVGDALQVAASGAKVNAENFVLLYNKGLSAKEVMDKLTGASRGWAKIARGAQIAARGFAAGIVTLSTIIRKSIKDFAEAAEETRRLTDQFGLSVEQADKWRRVANVQGQSARTLARAFTQVASNLTNYQIRLAEGEERVVNFQRALDAMNISVRNVDGSMRDSEDIINDINKSLRELGPGWTTAGLAQDIYGRGAYTTVIPAILDQTLSMERLNEIARETASTMSIEDVKAANEYREATSRLDAAIKGVGRRLSRAWLPTIEKWTNTVADTIIKINEADARERALADTREALKSETIRAAQEQEFYNQRIAFYTGISSEAAKSEEELTRERAKTRQETILAELAERKLAEQREAALEKATDLQTRFNEKLADIEVDFSDRWEDILIDRARDAEERTIEMFQKLEDIWRKNQRKLEDISIKADNRIADLERDRAEITEDFQARSNKKREDLELKHQERLWKIQMRFLDTVEEAARRNDAVAVVAAMRRRRRELRDAERQKQVEQRDLGRDLNERRREINRDFDRRKQDALRQQAEEEARAQLALDRALEDFKIANERERKETLRKYKEQEEDFNRAKSRAQRDARTWYRREQIDLQRQLNDMSAIAVRGILDTGQAAAQATATAAVNVVQTAVRRIQAIGGGTLYVTVRTQVEDNDIIGGRAAGGVDIVNRPTTVTMGEAGSELHAFIPLNRAMNVSHQFSRLPIDLNGAQGMNPQEVRSIIYDAMTDFASKLMPRWTTRR